MIQVGDLVRFSNKYLKDLSFKRSRKGRRLRRKNQIMRVLSLSNADFDWKTRNWNQIATLDVSNPFFPSRTLQISVYWLCFHSRPKERGRVFVETVRGREHLRVWAP